MANRALLTLLLLLGLPGAALAQLDQAQIELHPQYPGASPFVLELSGTWNGTCTPEGATPTITQFDGTRLFIELDHEPRPCVTDTPVHYRLLVDVSPAFEGDESYDGELLVRIEFAGQTLITTLSLECPAGTVCADISSTAWPETGLYQSRGLDKQGLLLARQGGALAVYPLVYDANGSSEWLFAGGALNGNTYFAPLYQALGGQCLACPPLSEPPNLEVIGNVTMLFVDAGNLLMQIDDGPFVEYQQSIYGYANVGSEQWPVTDLSGRWAILESSAATTDEGSIPPIEVLPQVFDVRFQEFLPPPPLADPPNPTAVYKLTTIEGQVITEMRCVPRQCWIFNPDFPDFSHDLIGPWLSAERIELSDRWDVPEGAEKARGVIVRVGP